MSRTLLASSTLPVLRLIIFKIPFRCKKGTRFGIKSSLLKSALALFTTLMLIDRCVYRHITADVIGFLPGRFVFHSRRTNVTAHTDPLSLLKFSQRCIVIVFMHVPFTSFFLARWNSDSRSFRCALLATITIEGKNLNETKESFYLCYFFSWHRRIYLKGTWTNSRLRKEKSTYAQRFSTAERRIDDWLLIMRKRETRALESVMLLNRALLDPNERHRALTFDRFSQCSEHENSTDDLLEWYDSCWVLPLDKELSDDSVIASYDYKVMFTLINTWHIGRKIEKMIP